MSDVTSRYEGEQDWDTPYASSPSSSTGEQSNRGANPSTPSISALDPDTDQRRTALTVDGTKV